MLYLEDVTVGKAPFRYLLGTHHPNPRTRRQWYYVARSGLEETYYDAATNAVFDMRAKVFTAPANTFLLFDNRGQHAGSLCREGRRVVLVNGFRPATGTRLNPRFLPDLPARRRARENVFFGTKVVGIDP